MSWKSFAGAESDVGLKSCLICFSSLLLPAFLQGLLIREIKALGVALWKMDQHLMCCPSLCSPLLLYCLSRPHSTKVGLHSKFTVLEEGSATVLSDHRNSGYDANNIS